MILLIGFTTLLLGQLLEIKTKYITKMLNSGRGKTLFRNSLTFFFTEAILIVIIAFFMIILKIDINFVVPIGGLILGEIMLVIVNKQQ